MKFPKRFIDPLRVEIAVKQIQHEFRKILPSLPYKEWQILDKDISDWINGQPFEMEPIFDFWNFFGGVERGLKLKSILFWVTAENIVWSKEKVKVDEIVVTWDYPPFESIVKAPILARDIRSKLDASPEKKEEVRQHSKERSNKYAPRDHFPLILFHDQNGGVINSYKGFQILDGNRRVAAAIAKDIDLLTAYVARFKDHDDLWPENYWFPASTLRDLVFLAIYFKKKEDDKSREVIRKFFQLLLREFDNVRIATIENTFKNYETDTDFIVDILRKDLK